MNCRLIPLAIVLAVGALAFAPPEPLDVGAAGNEPSGYFTPLPPSRVLDTRNGTGAALRPIGDASTIELDVTGVGGVPETGATAVVLNVTVVAPTRPGYLTIYPAGTARPLASSINFPAGAVVGNQVVAKIGVDGRISIFNFSGDTDVVADVAGWYGDAGTEPGAGRFIPLAPSRVLDTRDGIGSARAPIGSASFIDLAVTGVGGVPSSGVTAVALNVTVVTPTRPGYLTVFPTGTERPLASSINFPEGAVVGNLVVAKVGDGGRVRIFNFSGDSHVVADVVGWYGDAAVVPSGSLAAPVAPERVLDTRDGTGGIVGPIAANTSITVPVVPATNVPASGVTAVILNVTVTEPSRPGFLTVFPTGLPRPLASSINFAAGQTVGNLVVATVGRNGSIEVFNFGGESHVVADVVGWFGPGQTPPAGQRSTADRPDDRDGFQIKLIYAIPADGPDRQYDTNGQIATSMASVQHWLAAESGGVRLRLDTDGGVPDITFVRLRSTDAQLLAKGVFLRDAIEEELRALGLADPFKLVMVYYDGSAPTVCGGGAWPPTLQGGVAAQYLRCNALPFGASASVPAYNDIAPLHEIFHTLGAAPSCAPHHTRDGHVADFNNDLMYAGDLPWDVGNMRLDVGRDDYWSHGRSDCPDLAKSVFMTPTATDATAPPGWGTAGT